jgi:hypothetical protein
MGACWALETVQPNGFAPYMNHEGKELVKTRNMCLGLGCPCCNAVECTGCCEVAYVGCTVTCALSGPWMEECVEVCDVAEDTCLDICE